MHKAIVLAIVLAASTLAGCTSGDDATPQEWTPPPNKVLEANVDSWPEFKDAKIRPGAQVLTPMPEGGTGQCTSNFLFRNEDNSTLYLGLAAHCLGSADNPALKGTPVTIGGIGSAGLVAWNLWEKDPAATADFALIEISNAGHARPFAHPAVMHYGGPTQLGNTDNVMTGEYVISYGHSGQRPNSDQDNPREGVVIQHTGEDIVVWTDHPGIQGDSGSGLMTSDGQAIGVLSRGTTNPTDGEIPNDQFPSINYYVELDTLLAHAVADLGHLELVTWELLEPANIPL